VRTTEELLWRKRSGSGLGNREYSCRDPLRWPRNTLYPRNLALTSPKIGGHSVGIVRSLTKATEFVFFVFSKDVIPVWLKVGIHNPLPSPFVSSLQTSSPSWISLSASDAQLLLNCFKIHCILIYRTDDEYGQENGCRSQFCTWYVLSYWRSESTEILITLYSKDAK
jgi:hypothetical protein